MFMMIFILVLGLHYTTVVLKGVKRGVLRHAFRDVSLCLVELTDGLEAAVWTNPWGAAYGIYAL